MAIWIGTGDHDRIMGEGGDDQAFGLAGDDLLYGGTGSDELWGGLGNDTLGGGFEGWPDQAIDDGATDTLHGGRGQDTLLGMDFSHDILRAGRGRDELYVNNDEAHAGRGHDIVLVQCSSDAVNGARNDIWLGRGQDYAALLADRGHTTFSFIHDLSGEDTLNVTIDRGDGTFASGQETFDGFDANSDRVIDAADTAIRDVGGDIFSVAVVDGSLRLGINDHELTLEHVAAVGIGQWEIPPA